jgi:N utilization substance protein B
MRRSEQRRAAVFALYQHAVTGRPLDDVFEKDAGSFTRALAHATADHAEELDEHIARYARGWSLDRIAPIDEAVETTKAFCGADAPAFVNGILGAILREVRHAA